MIFELYQVTLEKFKTESIENQLSIAISVGTLISHYPGIALTYSLYSLFDFQVRIIKKDNQVIEIIPISLNEKKSQ